MSKKRFDKAFAAFRARGEERMTPKTFFAVLAAIERDRAEKPIELRARVVGGQLRFEPSSEVIVRDNEIVVGDRRIRVTVA